MAKRKRSEILADTIKMMDEALKEYRVAFDCVGEQDKLKCDILHKIELENGYEARCKNATELKTCLKDRRYYKDIVEETAPIVEFRDSTESQRVLNQMKELLGKLRKEESYHANRHYKPRIVKE